MRLAALGTRQFEQETEAARVITALLAAHGISYFLQPFTLDLPWVKKAALLVDGQKIPCFSIGLVSGEVQQEGVKCNLACEVISRDIHYFNPTVAVAPKDWPLVLSAQEICGRIEVERRPHCSANILVGNKENPKRIAFAHFDSIGRGAIDNASGVAVMLAAIVGEQGLLRENLFVFSGCEELSFDNPNYWGYGYRVFEKEYDALMRATEKIVVVDCLGYSPTGLFDMEEIRQLTFPVKNLDLWEDKIKVLIGDFQILMSVLHSDHDDGRMIEPRFLAEAKNILVEFLAR